MNIDKLNINFMGARRMALAISAVVIAFSLVSLVARGLNFGLDFTGGYLMELTYAGEADLADIRAALNEEEFDNPLVQNFGTTSDVLVRLPLQADAEGAISATESSKRCGRGTRPWNCCGSILSGRRWVRN